VKYWRCIGHYNAETQAYSACAGTFQTSPFTPDVGGTLLAVKLLEGQEAATSLTCDVQIRLSCAIWKPNTMDVTLNGGGLKTVPVAFQAEQTYVVEQPVQAGVPITVEGRNATATGVTVSVLVMGMFQA
jgi:hypothetical protein